MRNTFSRYLTPVTLLEWGGILLYFYLSGRLQAFLHPSFRPQVLVAGIFLFACGSVLLWANQKTSEWDSIGDNADVVRKPVNWFLPVMLLLPFALAAFFTKDAFGSQILTTRGVAETASALPGAAEKYSKLTPSKSVVEPALPVTNPQEQSAPPPIADPSVDDFFKPNAAGNLELNVVDLLYAAEEPSLRAPFTGKPAELVGQFMPAKLNNPSGSRFKLVRLFMTCCAADAQPISLLIEKTGSLSPEISDMTWIRVTGEVSFPVENGRTIAVFKAEKVEPVPPPDETMLY